MLTSIQLYILVIPDDAATKLLESSTTEMYPEISSPELAHSKY